MRRKEREIGEMSLQRSRETERDTEEIQKRYREIERAGGRFDQFRDAILRHWRLKTSKVERDLWERQAKKIGNKTNREEETLRRSFSTLLFLGARFNSMGQEW